MAELKIVISDPKTGKSYSKTLESNIYEGLKLGDKVSGNDIGLSNVELEISGGSDSTGVPMRRDMPGTGKKKALLNSGTGVSVDRKGKRIRKTVAGNMIFEKTAQVNLKVLNSSKPIEEFFATPKEEAPVKGETSKEEAQS